MNINKVYYELEEDNYAPEHSARLVEKREKAIKYLGENWVFHKNNEVKKKPRRRSSKLITDKDYVYE